MFRELWQLAREKKVLAFGLVVVAFFVALALLAPWLAPYSPTLGSGAPFESPSLRHLLGTNDVGVDVLSELIFASRVSLAVGIVAALIVLVVGSLVGLAAGFFGGYVDEVLMRVTDAILILPRLPLMVVMGAYLGPGLWTIILVYSLVGWASVARQVRAQVLSLRELSFVEAARATGAGNLFIVHHHILPNISGLIVANGVLEIMYAILVEAGLSFLGLGDPTHKSWGVMLHFAQIRGAFLQGAWWWIFPPGICIALVGCAFNFIGTALSDAFALRLRKEVAQV